MNTEPARHGWRHDDDETECMEPTWCRRKHYRVADLTAGYNTAVLLVNPKTPYNVAGALRACAYLGADELRWTGHRVVDPRKVATMSKATSRARYRTPRFPREERMRHHDTSWGHIDDEYPVQRFERAGLTPVCVEIVPGAEPLPGFEHPERAVYIFGPEDSSVPKGIRAVCHRFLWIPSTSCLNLAAAVNVVLYDRLAKSMVYELAATTGSESS